MSHDHLRQVLICGCINKSCSGELLCVSMSHSSPLIVSQKNWIEMIWAWVNDFIFHISTFSELWTTPFYPTTITNDKNTKQGKETLLPIMRAATGVYPPPQVRQNTKRERKHWKNVDSRTTEVTNSRHMEKGWNPAKTRHQNRKLRKHRHEETR